MNNMFQALTVAKKEYSDALKNKVFLTFLLFLVGLTIISIFVGSLDFQSKVSVYQKAYQQLIQRYILQGIEATNKTIKTP